MQELLAESLRPVNLPFTILLGGVIVYWLLVALGTVGIDLGADADTDADLGSDGGGHGALISIFEFLNLGEVPLTMVLSVYALCLWTFSMIANFYWAGESWGRTLIALAAIFVAGAIVTRYITLPFRPLMRALNSQGVKHIPVVGRTCQITTTEANSSFGQAQIETKGAPILINVRTMSEAPLPRGSTGLIVKSDPEKELYYIVEVSPDRLT